MPEIPFRLAVLQALTARLKTITPDNGYYSDLADFEQDGVTIARVYRGRDEFGESDPRPMVSILEAPSALEQLLGTSTSTSAAGEWDLFIQGFVTDDELNPTDPAHYLAADVAKALAAEIQRDGDILGFGGRKPCVTAIKIGAAVCRPSDEGISDVAFFLRKVTLVLSEDHATPFIST